MSRLQEGIDFYYDEHDHLVFTEQYHLNKGYCCGHGCRHCPYDYDAVPEPRRTLALKERNNGQQKTSNQTSNNR